MKWKKEYRRLTLREEEEIKIKLYKEFEEKNKQLLKNNLERYIRLQAEYVIRGLEKAKYLSE